LPTGYKALKLSIWIEKARKRIIKIIQKYISLKACIIFHDIIFFIILVFRFPFSFHQRSID